MTTHAAGRPATLADVLPGSRARDVALVIGFALLTALSAQVVIPLGFTPVPITGQTFAVLLAGGLLGARRGAASQALYLGLGAIGLPFFAEGTGGWEVVTGLTHQTHPIPLPGDCRGGAEEANTRRARRGWVTRQVLTP